MRVSAGSNCELLTGIVEEVEIRRILPPKSVLRIETGQVDELMNSISRQGLLHPIVVRPMDHHFEVVAGMRRLESCRRLGFRKIPSHIVHLDDRQAYEVSLSENVQRKTLNPVEEARAFKTYIDQHGYGGVSELARAIGKSEPYVSQRLRLLQLPEDILDKVVRRLITPSHAAELLGLVTDGQNMLVDLAMKKGLSSKRMREISKRMRESHDINAPDFQAECARTDEPQLRLERTIDKCIALLKTTLIKFDGVIDGTPDENWMAKEILASHRGLLHKQIDSLITFERRLRRVSVKLNPNLT